MVACVLVEKGTSRREKIRFQLMQVLPNKVYCSQTAKRKLLRTD